MKLLDQLKREIRLKNYSIRTEEAYAHWVKRFILFHDKRHPNNMSEKEIHDFLSYLANHKNVAASTQNQALNALVFLYKNVLHKELGNFSTFIRAKRPSRRPVVMTKNEVNRLFANIYQPTARLMTQLIYGTGMRLMECLRLRVKDIDFEQHHILIRDPKWQRDRVSMLPENLAPKLSEHLLAVQAMHKNDLRKGFGSVYLPNALAQKYPKAPFEWPWQFVFP